MDTRSRVDNPNDPLASAWLARVIKADKYFDEWHRAFKCNTMEEYYYGFQFQDGSAPLLGSDYERYVINHVFSILEVKKPTLLFQNVMYRVKPRPAAGEWDFVASSKRARTREDVLNTIVRDPDQEFDGEFEMFVVDAFFRFGIMEIGYSADWIENPNAGKPILKTDNTPYVDPDAEKGQDNVIREPNEIPESERVYMKRIMPWRFRVGGSDGWNFKSCNWVGYYDYVRLEDLKANKTLDNVDKLEYAGSRSSDFVPDAEADQSTSTNVMMNSDLVKIFILFDLRARMKYIFAVNQTITLLKKKIKRCPLTALKFVNKLRGWYPVPLAFNWKGPQDEINESREQQRIHRRRSRRVYTYADGTFADDNEMDKACNGPDMTWVKTQGNPADKIKALENAPLDSIVAQSMITGKNDLNEVSGTSAEQQMQGNRTTATQAGIIDQRTQLRETRARVQVANALAQIGRLVLLTVQEHFTLSFWAEIRTQQDNEDFLAEMQIAETEWREFTAKDLGEDEDFKIEISIDSISPIENAAQKQAFVEFNSMLMQFPHLAFDPVLVRETAYRCNYRNERVIARLAMEAQLAAIGRMEMAKQQLAATVGAGGEMPGGSNMAQTRVEQMQPPDQAQIQSQLAGQGIPVQ